MEYSSGEAKGRKLTSAIKGMYKVCRCVVGIESLKTEKFINEECFRQGNVLSPFVFTILTMQVIRKAGSRMKNFKEIEETNSTRIYISSEEGLQRSY